MSCDIPAEKKAINFIGMIACRLCVELGEFACGVKSSKEEEAVEVFLENGIGSSVIARAGAVQICWIATDRSGIQHQEDHPGKKANQGKVS